MENNTSKFKTFMLSKTAYWGMIALLYLIIWGIMVALTSGDAQIVAFIYMAVFSYFGWKALNKITPDVFLIMPLIGWVIFFVVKFVLSLIVGMFVAPFQIAKMLTNAIQKSIK